jgi:hypothetical protein
MQQNCCGGQLTKKGSNGDDAGFGGCSMTNGGDHFPTACKYVTCMWKCHSFALCNTFWMTSFSKLSFLCVITTQTKGKDSLKTCWRSDRTDQNPTFMSMLTIQRESNHKTLLINPFVSQYSIHPFICGFPFSEGIKNH